MKRFFSARIPLVLVLTFFLIGCGNSITPTAVPSIVATDTALPIITKTPDPCAPGNIEIEVDKVHKHMREFDDASILAANVAKDQISDAIANLQRIRRETEDQPIPECLANLKTYQIAHMNSVIDTLIAFMSSGDQQSIDQSISIARQQHDQYTLELARVLGLTIITATAPVADATLQSPSP